MLAPEDMSVALFPMVIALDIIDHWTVPVDYWNALFSTCMDAKNLTDSD